jgi:2-keto-4-pentenoate hydratase/2-oxohepta-3-ene-1,7-dioic acid hydratase in catechol pathway
MKKFIRFQFEGRINWGIVGMESYPQVKLINGSLFENWEIGDSVGLLSELELCSPCSPKNIVGLALNYRDLVEEVSPAYEPLVFLKAASSLISGDAQIRKPFWVKNMWVEVELAIVVKKHLWNASVEEASEAILGYVVANDVTAENVYERDHHLARSKSLPSFCPVSSFLVCDIKTDNLRLVTRINGSITQESSTSKRILNDAEALALVSKIVPLSPGDLVLTGTPAGALNSLVTPGDQVILEIEKIGQICNEIVSV